MLSLEFLVTSFVVVLVPGTGVVYSVSTGLIQGRRASVFAALGGVAGIVPHLLATILGLAAVLHTSALAWQVLKYAGAPLQQMLLLSAVFMLMTFVVFLAYGFLAHVFRVWVIDSPRVQGVLRRTFAASFAGLGAHLALSER